MKKVLFTLLAITGLSAGANAQNCCATEKENCEPKVCCPTTPDCCEDDKSTLKTVELTKKKRKATKRSINKTNAIKKEIAIVETKK